ncbi:MAG: hypothetical protein HLUCCO16_01705 [Phormidium sp. OSCR]|nr:MAG: hypothetical protein HLUCCO16_01705 [Phormidium sp. OSCR]
MAIEEGMEVFPYLFPARGRKLWDLLEKQQLYGKSFPIFSPQGDGNFGVALEPPPYSHVFPYLFPARGRKHEDPRVSHHS